MKTYAAAAAALRFMTLVRKNRCLRSLVSLEFGVLQLSIGQCTNMAPRAAACLESRYIRITYMWLDVGNLGDQSLITFLFKSSFKLFNRFSSILILL